MLALKDRVYDVKKKLFKKKMLKKNEVGCMINNFHLCVEEKMFLFLLFPLLSYY